MKILHSASSKARIVKMPIDSAGTTMPAGTLLTMGVTANANMGALILSGAAGADAFGILLNEFTNAADVDSTIEDGLIRSLADVEMLAPGDLVAIDYDLTDTVALASGSTTTGVVTSSDEETGCWHYFTAGSGIGILAYIKSYATDTATYKSAITDPSASSPFLIRIVAPGRTLVKLTTDRVKLGTDASEGTCRFLVLRNEFKINGQDWEELDYVKHHGLTGLNNKGIQFRAIGAFQDLATSPID